ncbi:hypothetical protein B566_EDAN017099 [Ephemera danica]|nr:hypothetical protein B566_EDAN017099 [Ephemera danica]
MKVIRDINAGLISRSEIAKKYELNLSTISMIYKNREKVLTNNSSIKRAYVSKPQFEELEQELNKFVDECKDANIPINGPILKEKAKTLALKLGYGEFRCSSGWLTKFKKRYNVSALRICGEDAKVSDDLVEDWHQVNDDIIKSYKPCDRFNMDETGLFFKCLPDSTLAKKGTRCHGVKKSKERITVSLVSNQDGTEKLKPVVIGKIAHPRAFKNVKELPVDYRFI